MEEQSALTLEEAARKFDPDSVRGLVATAEEKRLETISRFPREHWPEMDVTEYALGQETKDNFSVWIERQTDEIGSIRGGSSRKMIIYKHANKPGWYFPPKYPDLETAWEQVRAGFVRAFELAGQGSWDDIEGIDALSPGPALVLKTLWIYFPNELLPITSREHLRHFLRVAGREDLASEREAGAIQLNRALLVELREIPALRDVPTKGLERLLYLRFSPMEPRLFKVAPGHDARFWKECLEGGYICVGSDEVGDLTQFESKQEYLEAYHETFADSFGTKGKVSEKANELWTLLDFSDGELIVANRGTSEVLGVGTVVPPGYVYDESRSEYKHTVRVDWDTSYAKTIPKQTRWTFTTVQPVRGDLRNLILEKGDESPADDSAPVAHDDPEDGFTEIAAVLERKRQAILYGPPGTGKTWITNRFADWWLRRRSGQPGDDPSTAGRLERITFHPSYSYEDFIEGFRPSLDGGGSVSLTLEKGVFRRFCERAAEDPDSTYLLMIDEINRANITKVFGELITLLEKDKRGLPARLPYSKEEFRIPPNVYLLGTMNTADRSIKLLDTALRRRFGFIERMPNPWLLAGAEVEGIALDELLEKLNQRVASRVGREKQIGHSYFLADEEPITDEEEFAAIFRDEIVPLLQEYALDDYRILAEFLGEEIVNEEALELNLEVLSDPTMLADALEGHLITSTDAES